MTGTIESCLDHMISLLKFGIHDIQVGALPQFRGKMQPFFVFSSMIIGSSRAVQTISCGYSTPTVKDLAKISDFYVAL
jgi:hypothetical protein